MLMMGEDIATAGGVFKTNEGLPEKYGLERIRNTPICENGFIGVALGMAVTGLRPVVEIMFSDFLPTAATRSSTSFPSTGSCRGASALFPSPSGLSAAGRAASGRSTRRRGNPGTWASRG